MRRLSDLIARFARLYGFGARGFHRRADPIRIGYGPADRRYG